MLVVKSNCKLDIFSVASMSCDPVTPNQLSIVLLHWKSKKHLFWGDFGPSSTLFEHLNEHSAFLFEKSRHVVWPSVSKSTQNDITTLEMYTVYRVYQIRFWAQKINDRLKEIYNSSVSTGQPLYQNHINTQPHPKWMSVIKLKELRRINH